jgi:hypothetical protein
MFYFKACKKCQGDLTLQKDYFGDFLKCMQCGTLIEVEVRDQGRHSLLNEAGAKALSRVKTKTAIAA